MTSVMSTGRRFIRLGVFEDWATGHRQHHGQQPSRDTRSCEAGLPASGRVRARAACGVRRLRTVPSRAPFSQASTGPKSPGRSPRDQVFIRVRWCATPARCRLELAVAVRGSAGSFQEGRKEGLVPLDHMRDGQRGLGRVLIKARRTHSRRSATLRCYRGDSRRAQRAGSTALHREPMSLFVTC